MALENFWIEALRKGDERALRALFDQYYRIMVGDAYRLVPDLAVCKDLAQDVFLELWRKRENLDIQTSIGAYLRRAAVNRALNYLKANRRLIFEEADALPQIPDNTSQDNDRREAQDQLENRLHQAIEALPEKCRVVFVLSRFEHLSHKEIAEQLGISTKTIENQITKAMKYLREKLIIDN